MVRDDRIGATVVLCDHEFIVATFDYEAEQLGTTANELALERAEAVREAMIMYRDQFSARSLIRRVVSFNE